MKPEAWERKGECSHCGYCCQFMGPATLRIEGAEAAFLKVRGFQRDEQGWWLRTHLFCPCPAHDAVAQRCTVYEERPRTCRDFPERPEQVEHTPCSYWFERRTSQGLERLGGTGSPYPGRTEERSEDTGL